MAHLEVAPCRETAEWNETASPHLFLHLTNNVMKYHAPWVGHKSVAGCVGFTLGFPWNLLELPDVSTE